jgi:two-component system OmpR family sensor kinase
LQPSEKRSLYRFITIYVLSLLALFVIVAALFYRFEVSSDAIAQKKALKKESERIAKLVKHFGEEGIADIKNVQIAIYDRRKNYIFGNFKPQDIDLRDRIEIEGGFVRYYGFIPPPHKRHTVFMITQRAYDTSARQDTTRFIFYTFVIFLLLVTVLGYYLGKLFIAPMREALEKLNVFIQDTTHELNTPIATILSNTEMMEILGNCNDSKELKRIEIASKTLSRIYDDLSYLNLNKDHQSQIEQLNISEILQDRLTYFSALIKAKKIALKTDIRPQIIKDADRADFFRLYDNLISNAIKYSNVGGSIDIALNQEKFVIRDVGRGMSKKMQQNLFERFHREDKSEGGFGIGLNIVMQICDRNSYRINIDSLLDHGTTVAVEFL